MPSHLSAQPIQTRIFRPGENLAEFIAQELDPGLVKEKMILAVTSKLFSLAERRLAEKTTTKRALVEREADVFLGEIGHGCLLTVKHGLLLASAGIDESNSESGQFILYPEDPYGSARMLGEALRARWKLQALGLIMTDSHTAPLRNGVTGIALAHWGFSGVRNLVGRPDLFGRKVHGTSVNVADALAAAATLVMGETDERCPIAILDCGGLEFTAHTSPAEVQMPMENDIYYPLFRERIK